MSTLSKPRGHLTRSNIMEAATDLFATQGYHGTSMRQIAMKACIALGGIYNHFSGKEEIFEAVFVENHPFLEMIPAIENAEGDTIEALVRDAADQMITAINNNPQFLYLMFIEIVEFKNAHTHKVFETIYPRGIKIVRGMVAGKEMVRDIPLPMLVRAFIGLFFSYHLVDVILGEMTPQQFRENAMEYYVDIFLHGILS